MDGQVFPPVNGASQLEASETTLETSTSRYRASERAAELYPSYAQADDTLTVSALGELLSAVNMCIPPDVYKRVALSVAGLNAENLTKEQALAVIGMLSPDAPTALGATSPSAAARSGAEAGPVPRPPSSVASGGQDSSGPSRPFRRILTKNRSYLETGALHLDEAVVSYLTKLEDHRRRCEVEGRYQEAKLASRRLADLRTAQVDSLRQQLSANQTRELEEVAAVFDEESGKFHAGWDVRMREYGASVGKALDDLRAAHTAQLAAFVEELQRRRPTRSRPSRDYLLQRDMQDKLAKAKLYGRATKVKHIADELYQAELETTVAAWEAESKLKISKLQAKQQTEYEVLLQRGAKGRDELELKRCAETERRALRYRNIVSELEQLHKLEMAHLENFLDAQVLAGKATPLRDPGAFRRKREQLFSLTLS